MAAVAVNTGVEHQLPKIYVCGGSLSGPVTNIVEEYDVLSDSWTTKAPLPFSQLEGLGATVNGKVYVIGGYDGNALDNVQEYDPTTNIWIARSAMITPRSQISGAVINNKVYVAGGWPGEYNILEVYNPATNSWTSDTSLPYGLVQNNGGVAVNNELYIIGGKTYDWNTIFDFNSKYSPVTNSWSAMAPMPLPRFSGAAVYYNGKIHFFGGTDGHWTPNYNTHYIYDTLTNTWSIGLPMPKHLSGHSAVVANNKVYIIGGYDSTGAATNVVIEYSEPITGIKTVNNNNVVNVFYRSGSIHISMSSKPQHCEVVIYDMSGRCVYRSPISTERYLIDAVDFPRGIYVVKLLSANGTQIKKLIVN
jgi:N-acetylneuraminic acid mutarotase